MQPPCGSHPLSCVAHNPYHRANDIAAQASASSRFISRIIDWLRPEKRPSKDPKEPLSALAILPAEILLIICEYLPRRSQAVLAFTCKAIQQRLGPTIWRSLRHGANWAEKCGFLELLVKDAPKFYFCRQCILLHAKPTRGHFGASRSGHVVYNWEPFYTLTLTHIRAALKQTICAEYLACATMCTIHLEDASSVMGVWCRPRIVNGRFLLHRHYAGPQSSVILRKPLSFTPAADDCPGLELCAHIKLTHFCISAGDLPVGAALPQATFTGDVDWLGPSVDEILYQYNGRCKACFTEFHLRDSIGVQPAVFDIYHILSDAKQINRWVVGLRLWEMEWWNKSICEKCEDDLRSYGRYPIREMFENAPGRIDIRQPLW